MNQCGFSEQEENIGGISVSTTLVKLSSCSYQPLRNVITTCEDERSSVSLRLSQAQEGRRAPSSLKT
jgi:hypothetical protein